MERIHFWRMRYLPHRFVSFSIKSESMINPNAPPQRTAKRTQFKYTTRRFPLIVPLVLKMRIEVSLVLTVWNWMSNKLQMVWRSNTRTGKVVRVQCIFSMIPGVFQQGLQFPSLSKQKGDKKKKFVAQQRTSVFLMRLRSQRNHLKNCEIQILFFNNLVSYGGRSVIGSRKTFESLSFSRKDPLSGIGFKTPSTFVWEKVHWAWPKILLQSSMSTTELNKTFFKNAPSFWFTYYVY